jgi:pimeloyl-ACP methyl ester carboxylesterase
MDSPGPWDIPSVARRLASPDVFSRGPAVVVGHSTGGAIALELALRFPALVSALVLVDTGPNMRDHGDVDGILQAMRDDWGDGLRAAIIDRSFATPPPATVRSSLLDYARRVPQQAALDVLTSQRTLDYAPRLPSLGMPVAVVHGVRDPVRTVDQARAFAAALPGASLALVDCGHTPPFEQPVAVAAALAPFLP